MMPDDYAPVAIFAFRRSEHLKYVIKSISNNPESIFTTLYVFVDGPALPDDIPRVESVKEYVSTISGFKQINVIYSDVNLGLSKSILTGVSMVLDNNSKVIVLEEDVVVSDGFLSYMNSALSKFKDNQNILSVSGYSYPFNNLSDAAYLMRVPHSWGWATWRSRWSKFDPNPSRLLDFVRTNPWVSHIKREAPYDFVKMLKNRVMNKNDSWLCSWAVHGYIHNMFTVYPSSSMCANIGIDGSGTHCSKWVFDPFKVSHFEGCCSIPDIPTELSGVGKRFLLFYFFKVHFYRALNKMLRVLKLI